MTTVINISLPIWIYSILDSRDIKQAVIDSFANETYSMAWTNEDKPEGVKFPILSIRLETSLVAFIKAEASRYDMTILDFTASVMSTWRPHKGSSVQYDDDEQIGGSERKQRSGRNK